MPASSMFDAPSTWRSDGYPTRTDSLAQSQQTSFDCSISEVDQDPIWRRHGYATEEEFEQTEARAKQRIHKIAPWIAGLQSEIQPTHPASSTAFAYPNASVTALPRPVIPAHEYLSKSKKTGPGCFSVAKAMGKSAQKAIENFKETAFNVRIEPASAKPRFPPLPSIPRRKSSRHARKISSPVLEKHIAWQEPGMKRANTISIKEAQSRDYARRRAFEKEQKQKELGIPPTLRAGLAREPKVNRAPRIQSTWGALIDAAHTMPASTVNSNSSVQSVVENLPSESAFDNTHRPQTIWPDAFGKLTLDFSKDGPEKPINTQDHFDSSSVADTDSWFQSEASSSAPTTPLAAHRYLFRSSSVLEGRFKHMSVDEDEHEILVDQHVRQGHISTYIKRASDEDYVGAWRMGVAETDRDDGKDPAAVLMQELEVARQTGGVVMSPRGGNFF